MEKRWLTLAVATLLLTGCTSKNAPPAGPPDPAKTSGQPGVKQHKSVRVDDFGLPLEINIEVPETPKEIQGPSPPIRKAPRRNGKPQSEAAPK